MTDEERDEILAAVAQQSRDTHFLLVAVIELLIERKVLNGKQEEFLWVLSTSIGPNSARCILRATAPPLQKRRLVLEFTSARGAAAIWRAGRSQKGSFRQCRLSTSRGNGCL